MHNPDSSPLQRVTRGSIPSMLQRQLQHAGPKAGQRLRNVRVSALGNDGQGAGQILPRPDGNSSKSFRAALIHAIGRVLRVIHYMLSYLTT